MEDFESSVTSLDVFNEEQATMRTVVSDGEGEVGAPDRAAVGRQRSTSATKDLSPPSVHRKRLLFAAALPARKASSAVHIPPRLRKRLSRPMLVIRSDTREQVYPYMVRVASTSHVHGLKECFTATTSQARLFWGLVCLFCLCAASFEIYHILWTYRNEGVATKMSFEPQETMQFPTLLICPTRWLSRQKIQELNVSAGSLDYLMWVLDVGLAVGSRPDEGFGDEEERARLWREEWARLKARWGWSRVSELMLGLAPVWHGASLGCSCCNESLIRRQVTLGGVCWEVPLCRFDLRQPLPPRLIHYDRDDLLDNRTVAGMAEGIFLSFVPEGERVSYLPRSPIFLEARQMWFLRLEARRVSRISTRERPCFQPSPDEAHLRESRSDCELRCVDRHKPCRGCSDLALFSLSGPPQCERVRNPLDAGRSLCNDSATAAAAEAVAACDRACSQPCVEDSHRVESYARLAADAVTSVALEFPSPTLTLIRDVETLNLHELLSSIGGQTGLWLGASVVTLLQLLSSFLCPCLHWTNLKTGYRSFRKTIRRPKPKPAQPTPPDSNV